MGKRKSKSISINCDSAVIFHLGDRAERCDQDLLESIRHSQRINKRLRRELNKDKDTLPAETDRINKSVHELEVVLQEAEQILFQDRPPFTLRDLGKNPRNLKPKIKSF